MGLFEDVINLDTTTPPLPIIGGMDETRPSLFDDVLALDKPGPVRKPEVIPSLPSPETPGRGRKYNIPGGVKDIGKLFYDIPVNITGAVASMWEDDNPEAEYDWKDIARKAQTVRNEQRAAEAGGEEYVLPWVQRKDIREAGASAGFSGVAMGAGLAGGIVASPIPVPGARVAGALAGSGLAAYNMDKAMFTQQLIDSYRQTILEDKNRDVTPDEVASLVEKTEDLRGKHALWEAIPEAVGNVAQLSGIGAIFKAALGKNLGIRVFRTLVGMYGAEIGTETITQIGQHNVEIEAGLSAGQKRSFLSMDDMHESFKEVAPQTFVLVSLTGGAGAVAGKTYQIVANPKDNADASEVNSIVGRFNKGEIELTQAVEEINSSNASEEAKESATNLIRPTEPPSEQKRLNLFASMLTQGVPVKELRGKATPQEIESLKAMLPDLEIDLTVLSAEERVRESLRGPVAPFEPQAEEIAAAPQAKRGLKRQLELAPEGLSPAAMSAEAFERQKDTFFNAVYDGIYQSTALNEDVFIDEAVELGQKYGFSPEEINQTIINGLMNRERDFGIPLSPAQIREYAPKAEKPIEREPTPEQEEMVKPSIKAPEEINDITRLQAGKMIIEGNRDVLKHLAEGVKKHTALTMQDAIRNQAMTEMNKAYKKGPEAYAKAAENWNKLKPEIDEILEGKNLEKYLKEEKPVVEPEKTKEVEPVKVKELAKPEKEIEKLPVTEEAEVLNQLNQPLAKILMSLPHEQQVSPYGPSNVSLRQTILQQLQGGKKLPKSKSGVRVVQNALLEAAGISKKGKSPIEYEGELRTWIKGIAEGKKVEPVPKPVPALKDITVEVTAIREATGEKIKVKENAETALKEAKEDVSEYQKLLDCLTG